MTRAIRIAVCVLALTAPGVVQAKDPTFGDLLARAHAQVAAGHKWTPVGDNVSETFSAMISILHTATPDQITEFEGMLGEAQQEAEAGTNKLLEEQEATRRRQDGLAGDRQNGLAGDRQNNLAGDRQSGFAGARQDGRAGAQQDAAAPAQESPVLGRQATTAAQPGANPSQPVVAERQPVRTEAPPVLAEGQPASAEAHPAASDTQPAVSERQPVVAAPQLVRTEAAPTVAQAQPAGAEARPATRNSQASASEPQSVVAAPQPARAEAPPPATGIQPTGAEARPAASDTQPAVAGTRPIRTDAQPVTVEAQPITAATMPVATQAQSATAYASREMPKPPAAAGLREQFPPAAVASPMKPMPQMAPYADDMFKRGKAAEDQGDISGARRYYSVAAQGGHAAAAQALGRLYDPDVLKGKVIGGISADPASAKRWYDRAAQLGFHNGNHETVTVK